MPETSYKYLDFFIVNLGPKTSIWSCRTKNAEELGTIRWYGPWRQYCFFPTVQAVYSAGCLRDIAAFIAQLEAERKDQK